MNSLFATRNRISRKILSQTNAEYSQGCIEPLKAARGHAASYSARTDDIVLSVTKNNISS